MKTYYKSKAKYSKIDDNGNNKNVTETFLVDAVSFTDAEQRMYERLAELVDGDFIVTSCIPSKYTDILEKEDRDTFYDARIRYASIDEGTGKTKIVSNLFLVAANDVKEAFEFIEEDLKTMLVPYTVHSITESPVIEVFHWESEEEEDE